MLESLSNRQQELLRAVIELYVKSGEPISSELIEKSYNLGVSPATIRNEMVRLTEMGYIRQPHTSAGRTPTVLGMRFYIGELMKEKQLPIVDEVTIRQQLLDQKARLEKMLKEATRALAKKCNTLALAYSNGEIYYTGASSILDFPEFDDIDVVRFILSLLDEGAILQKIIDKAQGTDSLHIIFGEETDYEYLQPASFAFINFPVGDKQGLIGVVGPARLNFPVVLPYLRYVGRLLTEAGSIW